jgi:transcriptional regulator of acetoin/glycerol metabolism
MAAPLQVSPPDPAHADLILRSHERCTALGLSRIERPDHARALSADLDVARERNRRLFTHAAPIMEMLLEQIVATQGMVVLTDAQGTVLHSVGHGEFLNRASKVALAPGANWSEPCKGTNAIGTALISELPTVVHASEHFLHANEFLTCSAVPVFDPRGNMPGVLDVSGDRRSYHEHTMGLIKMSARMIENSWLNEDFRHALRLHFHGRPGFLGTLMEGIVAVGHDGRLLAANRSALDQLGVSGAALRMSSLSGLLGTTFEAIVDHFRSPMAAPLRVMLPDGSLAYLQARFSWPAWHAVGSPLHGAAAGGVEAPAAAALLPGPAPVGSLPAAAAMRSPPAAVAPLGLRDLQTGDAAMDAVVGRLLRVLDRDVSVLVQGETGTGKELLARAMHAASARAHQPFVAVNCAAIPEGLIESELFGYEEGAFTGARRKGSMGKIAQASGGTLFLDEIGDMPLALQARLLRVLQDRQVVPLGGSRAVPVDVAVVTATHRNLREMIERQAFREDLYYRLNGLVVRLPALRERSDLPALVQKILRTGCSGPPPALDGDVVKLLQHYRWPGNVRQLASVLRTAVLMAGDERRVTREHLPDDLVEEAAQAVAAAERPPAGEAAPGAGNPAVPPDTPPGAPATMQALELQAIRVAVEAAGGNISVAARRLGISRNTIYRRLHWHRSG